MRNIEKEKKCNLGRRNGKSIHRVVVVPTLITSTPFSEERYPIKEEQEKHLQKHLEEKAKLK
jgi:hypothetical protein